MRLSDETANKLDRLAQKIDSSSARLAAEAIEDYVARQEWQLAEIEAGLAEADQGAFVSDADLTAIVAKYVKPAFGAINPARLQSSPNA